MARRAQPVLPGGSGTGERCSAQHGRGLAHVCPRQALCRDTGSAGVGPPSPPRAQTGEVFPPLLAPTSPRHRSRAAVRCPAVPVPGAGGGDTWERHPGAAASQRRAARHLVPAALVWLGHSPAINNPAPSCQGSSPSAQGGAAPRCLQPPPGRPLCPSPLRAPARTTPLLERGLRGWGGEARWEPVLSISGVEPGSCQGSARCLPCPEPGESLGWGREPLCRPSAWSPPSPAWWVSPFPSLSLSPAPCLWGWDLVSSGSRKKVSGQGDTWAQRQPPPHTNPRPHTSGGPRSPRDHFQWVTPPQPRLAPVSCQHPATHSAPKPTSQRRIPLCRQTGASVPRHWCRVPNPAEMRRGGSDNPLPASAAAPKHKAGGQDPEFGCFWAGCWDRCPGQAWGGGCQPLLCPACHRPRTECAPSPPSP